MNRRELLLTCLAEEAAEVAQAASKMNRFGMHETFHGKPNSNAEIAHYEIDDLLAIIELLNAEFDFGYETNSKNIALKKIKVDKMNLKHNDSAIYETRDGKHTVQIIRDDIKDNFYTSLGLVTNKKSGLQFVKMYNSELKQSDNDSVYGSHLDIMIYHVCATCNKMFTGPRTQPSCTPCTEKFLAQFNKPVNLKFHELSRGQAFRFASVANEPFTLLLSAGVDGYDGRFVSSWSDWQDPEEWLYCSPNAEVIPET